MGIEKWNRVFQERLDKILKSGYLWVDDPSHYGISRTKCWVVFSRTPQHLLLMDYFTEDSKKWRGGCEFTPFTRNSIRSIEHQRHKTPKHHPLTIGTDKGEWRFWYK